MPVLHESDVPEQALPGRSLRWVVNEELLGAENCSVCVIRVQAGETVRPAHAHPEGEEVLYIVTGSGRVWIDEEISEVTAGSLVLFPTGKPHMLQNNGDEEMKVVCFFSPAVNLSTYKHYPDKGFPMTEREKEAS